MRKLMVLMTVVVVSFTLGACRQKDYDLYVYNSKGESAAAFDQMCQDFAEEKDVDVKCFSIGSGQDHMETLRADMNSRNKPAVFSVQGYRELEEWLAGGFALPLEADDEFTLPNLIKFGQGGITVENKLYGIPYNVEGYGYVYDTQMMTDLGLSTQDVESLRDGSYDDFVAFVEAVDAWINDETLSGNPWYDKIKNTSKTGSLENLDSVFAFAGAEPWTYGDHLVNIPFNVEFPTQEQALNAKTIEFTAVDAYYDALRLQVKNSKEGFGDTLVGVTYDDSVKVKFGGGQSLLLQQGNWAYGSIKSQNPDKAERLAFLPVKIDRDDVANDSIPVFSPNYYAINSKVSEEEQQLAKEFLQWLHTSEIGKNYILNEFNFIPAVEGISTTNLDPLAQSITDYIDRDKTLEGIFMAMPGGWSFNTLGTELQKEFLKTGDRSDFDEVITNAKQKWADARE